MTLSLYLFSSTTTDPCALTKINLDCKVVCELIIYVYILNKL